MEFEYRTALRQQDMNIDLKMNERAKMWEIQKMELRSQADFAEEERKRKRKADETQAKLDALEKAFESGVISKEEHKKLALRLTTGIPFPATEKRITGMPPWWTDPELAKTKEGIAARKKALRETTDITKRTDVDAAMKFLQEYEEKKEKAATFYYPFAPEPTPEEETAAEFYKGIIEGITPTPDRSVEDVAEPVTNAEFENNVKQLAAIDIDKARAYHKKWISKFQKGFEVIEKSEIEEPVIETPASKKRRSAKVGKIDWDYIMSKGF